MTVERMPGFVIAEQGAKKGSEKAHAKRTEYECDRIKMYAY